MNVAFFTAPVYAYLIILLRILLRSCENAHIDERTLIASFAHGDEIAGAT